MSYKTERRLPTKSAKKRTNPLQRGAKVFYCVMIALPLLQFLIFYIGVNFNSILLAFQQITPEVKDGTVEYVTSFAGLDTFRQYIQVELASESYRVAITNSLIYMAFSLLVVMPLGLLFSFYIFKKYRFASLYRVFLFLPSVICSLIMVIFYQYLVDMTIPDIYQNVTGETINGLLTTTSTAFVSLVFFNFWFSFGPSSLVYCNAMSQISPTVIEAAELDGATGIKQFWHVVLPSIFPSITSYIIICVAQIAVNQLNGYSFFGASASDYGVQTIGYKLFTMVANDQTTQSFPVAAAGGILFTLVIAPLTILLRVCLEKFGPKED